LRKKFYANTATTTTTTTTLSVIINTKDGDEVFQENE